MFALLRLAPQAVGRVDEDNPADIDAPEPASMAFNELAQSMPLPKTSSAARRQASGSIFSHWSAASLSAMLLYDNALP